MSNPPRRHILIVGGGVGGLAAAARISHTGNAVTVFEKNDHVGGKLNLWETKGYRFDTGPSLLTLPQVFRELFADLGEPLASHLTFRPLDPIQRFVWPDGASATISATPNGGREGGRLEGLGDSANLQWQAFLARGKQIWDLSAEMFLYHAPDELLRQGPFDWRKGLSMLSIPLRIGMFSRYVSEIHRRVSHPKVREILYQYATYAGASPFKAPGTLAVIPYAESGLGGWYIQGGLYRLAEVLQSLIQARGGTIRLNAEVAEVLIESGSAKGVRLTTGETLLADAVVVNADVVPAYRNLIAPQWRKKFSDRRLAKLEPGGSGMVLLLGVEGPYPQLAHHTKFMPADYRSDLRAMFDTGTIPEDPCIYVCAASRTDPTVAPPNCENLFILVSAPPLNHGEIDWSLEGPRYRDQIIRTLETKWGLTDLSKRIQVERRMTPEDLQRTYHANAGSIYGISSNSRLGAFLRPPNRDPDLQNLFFVGGATHPGGGLPLVTLSAKIVAEMINHR